MASPPEARYPSGKGEVCKTFMRRFDPDPRLQKLSSPIHKRKHFYLEFIPESHISGNVTSGTGHSLRHLQNSQCHRKETYLVELLLKKRLASEP